MRQAIGINVAEQIRTGLVEGGQLAAPLRVYHEPPEGVPLLSMHAADIAQCLAREVQAVAGAAVVGAIGIGFPGIIRNGLIEELANLPQLKGVNIQGTLAAALRDAGIRAPVQVYNDAEILAAGLATTRGYLDRLVRVWTLGHGVGFGVFPWQEGIWEGGHIVVSLDPRERYCGCGGRGHLEGIMGHRAMRLRFLDMEPDEIFEKAHQGIPRCVDFIKLWHAALAAATTNSIHLAGPGKFFLSGFNAHHVDINLLNQYMHEMVRMSTLQSYVFEIVPASDEIAVIGAAVNALRAVFPE